MAESIKRPRATKPKIAGEVEAKTRKAPAPENPRTAPPTSITGSAPTHEQIAELARKYWAQRGYADGHHEEDWLRAEKELRAKAS